MQLLNLNLCREEEGTCIGIEDADSCGVPDHRVQAGRTLGRIRGDVLEVDAATSYIDGLGRGLQVAAGLIVTGPRPAGEVSVNLNDNGVR